jgi:hypothetical protein
MSAGFRRIAWMMAGGWALLFCLNCARAPANAGSGVRLVVTLRFNGPINDNYQYFVLIRNGGDQTGQNGPIPVVTVPYLNGFATGQNTVTAGFTDFVEYSRVQRQNTISGYALYHLPNGIDGDPNRNIFEARGEPVLTTPPGGSNILRFELDLNQIKPNSGERDPNNGERPRYLQINVVATTTTPTNPQVIDNNKIVDALGDQRIGSGSFNYFITLDTAQIGRIYQSVNNPGDPNFEPEGDLYPDNRDPRVDLLSWSIQITGR